MVAGTPFLDGCSTLMSTLRGPDDLAPQAKTNPAIISADAKDCSAANSVIPEIGKRPAVTAVDLLRCPKEDQMAGEYRAPFQPTIDLISRYSRKPNSPHSRPLPDLLKPPNGA